MMTDWLLLQPQNETQRRTAEICEWLNALCYGRSTFDSFLHRKKLKAQHDDVEAIYFIITVMGSPDKLFSHEWSSSWALNLVPLGQNLSLELVRQLRSGQPWQLSFVPSETQRCYGEQQDITIINPHFTSQSENAKPYEVVLKPRWAMPMKHAIPQLDLGDTCRKVSKPCAWYRPSDLSF